MFIQYLAKYKQVHREFIKLNISKLLEREQQLDDLVNKKIEAENRKNLDDLYAKVNAKINNFK